MKATVAAGVAAAAVGSADAFQDYVRCHVYYADPAFTAGLACRHDAYPEHWPREGFYAQAWHYDGSCGEADHPCITTKNGFSWGNPDCNSCYKLTYNREQMASEICADGECKAYTREVHVRAMDGNYNEELMEMNQSAFARLCPYICPCDGDQCVLDPNDCDASCWPQDATLEQDKAGSSFYAPSSCRKQKILVDVEQYPCPDFETRDGGSIEPALPSPTPTDTPQIPPPGAAPAPTDAPQPTEAPTAAPTPAPTAAPTPAPTAAPTQPPVTEASPPPPTDAPVLPPPTEAPAKTTTTTKAGPPATGAACYIAPGVWYAADCNADDICLKSVSIADEAECMAYSDGIKSWAEDEIDCRRRLYVDDFCATIPHGGSTGGSGVGCYGSQDWNRACGSAVHCVYQDDLVWESMCGKAHTGDFVDTVWATSREDCFAQYGC